MAHERDTDLYLVKLGVYGVSMDIPTTLRSTLQFNAAFSFASGVLLSIWPGSVDDWLGTSVSTWLRLFGIVLIGHALVILVVQRRDDIAGWARLNLLAIAPYPLCMVVAALLVGSSLGVALVLIDGAIIGAIAATSYRGLRAVSV